MSARERRLIAVSDLLGDNVKRWHEEILPEYPQARYTADAGFFYGALRDEDDVMRRSSLGLLIDALLAREGRRP
jgi:hypothetical protein